MADPANPFESLADRLPPEQRKRWLALSVQLRNLPQGDTLALALEALGFTGLVLKEIPDEIASVLGEFRNGLSEAQREQLREDMAGVLEASLDTPSYADLRETIRLMGEHHGKVRRETNEFMKALASTRRLFKRRHALLPSIAVGLAAGVAASALTFLFSLPFRDAGTNTPAGDPLAEVPGVIDYLETDAPEYGGKVGMVVVGGDVLAAFEEGERGVVVVRPLSQP